MMGVGLLRAKHSNKERTREAVQIFVGSGRLRAVCARIEIEHCSMEGVRSQKVRDGKFPIWAKEHGHVSTSHRARCHTSKYLRLLTLAILSLFLFLIYTYGHRVWE